MSSDEIYKKNKAMLIAENTRPTRGTKIGGKKVAVIIGIFCNEEITL